MKKNRLLAIFAAATMAAVSFLTPIADDIGFSVPASAVAKTTGGGLWVSPVTDTPDADYDRTKPAVVNELKIFQNSLKPGDTFQLNITVPKLNANLGNLQLKIKYDREYFTCKQWYQTGWERQKNPDLGNYFTSAELNLIETWPAAGDFIGNGHGTGDSNFRSTSDDDITVEGDKISGNEAYLVLTSPSAATGIDAFAANSATIFARFEVSQQIDEISQPTFKIVQHLFDEFESAAADPDIWDPAADQTTATVTIAGVISGTITGYDFDTNPALTVTIKSSAHIDWYTVPDVATAAPVVTTDGSFEFKGLTPGENYSLTVNAWCLDNKKDISKTEFDDMTYDIGDWNLWLYGDVTHDGAIGAEDATQILRYIVGKPSVITSTTCDEYKIANVTVDTDTVVNVRDATQILRKACGKNSVFDNKPPYVAP